MGEARALLLGLCLVVGLTSALGGEPPRSCTECQSVVLKDASMACASSKFKISCKAQFAKLKATCTKLVEEECLRNCSATQAKACSTDAMCVMPVGGKDADFSCECKRGFTGDGFRCIVDPEFDESVEDAKAVEAAAAQAAAPTSKPKPDICFQKLGIKNGGCHGDASCGFHPQTFEMKCQCNEGYQGDGKSCTDWCALDNGGCSAKARCNKEVTYGKLAITCVCKVGYTGNGFGCHKIMKCDSCHENSTCTMNGAVPDCSCNRGFSGSGISCEPIDECLSNNGGCSFSANCSTLSPGNRTCTCYPGYVTKDNGVNCEPQNPCTVLRKTSNSTKIYGGCNNNAKCTMFKLKTGAAANTCACNAGYSGNGRSSCEEVDGCLFKNGGCDELHASCTKVHTTKYICKCQEGWTGNGKKCTQIEACSVEHGGCADMATCAREAGGGANTSACKCNAGFEGDGSICTPVNPCAPTAFGIAEAEMKNMTLKYPCSSFAKCNSAAPGDHTCACNNGYSGDGKECAEVDMCGDPSIMNCSKHATCTQLKPGKAECTCKQYYLGDGRECNITCELKEFECRHGALLDMDKCKCVKCPAPWTGETCNICTRAGTYPALDLCVNGGRLDKSTCKCIDCPPPWSGELCNVCPYKPEDCLGRGTLNTKTCRCDACAYPWAGKMCDRCELKKTDCRLEYHSFAYVEPQNCECTNCTRGWGGPNCNECTLNRCKHGGKVSKTSCNCYYCNDGWMGDYCETCGLTQSHCLHGGKLNEETCQCESCKGGWGGQTCNACNFTQADCKSGTFDVDDCTCKQCNALMGGDLCEICERSDAECGHGGQMDGSTCQCMYCEAPWTGENCTKCPIQQSQCKHGSTLNKGACNCFPCQSNGPVDRYCDECKLAQKDCKNQGTFDRTSCSCKCKGQWSGDICNACPVTDKTCVNGTWSDKLCKCVCTASYSGSKCNECALDSCEHGAVLDKSGCRCKCNAPWTGPSCGVCLLTDKACKNGGKVDPVLCQCIDCDSEPNELSVWAGLLCDKCQLRKDTCKHGAVLNPDTCTCDKCNFNVTHAFWKGDRCNTCIPEDLDLCTRNGGSKDFAKCKCACPMDFAGKYCEKKACPRDPSTFWECSTNPDPEATDEHGLCMRNSEEQTSKCKCNIPWGGPACSQLGERTYCSMRGLSHGTNFDGARFDYPSTGEFVFARYTQDPSEETVHITKMKLGDRSMSSVVSGLAIKRNDATVSFVVDTHKREIDNLEKNADIYYECSTKTSMLMKYSDVVAGAEKGYTFPNGVKVAAAGNRYIITTDSGTVIWLNKVNTATAPIEKVQSFLLHMSISQPKGGYMEGVCGNFDGQNDQTDDFLPKYIVAKDESLFECAQPSPKAVFSRMSITDRYGAIDRDPDDRDVMPTSVGYCATEEKQRKGAPEVCCDMCKKYASEGVSECDDCKKDYCLTGLSGVANMAQSSFEEFTAFHKEVIELKSQDHKFGEELKSKKKVVGGTELR